ncbi:MAG: FAD binding domain-containing protein [Phycisphaerales bacterium]|nr:MAG: FAD binding domain-containing protein [Phycisphaerales bacterium]
MKVLQPSTLDEALDMMATADTALTPIAGGTDLLVSWHHVDKDSLHLLDLTRLRKLQAMRMTKRHLELGGLTTYWQVIKSPEVARAFPLLAECARLIGAIQVQTRGTWAGNIQNGSPAADGVAVMMAYDATVILQSRDGRTEVPLDRYYTGYKQTVRRGDQLITAIRMPRRRRIVEWFEKVGARRAQAIAKLGVAAVRDTRGWRIAANSVAPYVCRCRALEDALRQGRSFGGPDEIRHALAPDICPITDVRSTATYRERVLSRILYFRLAENGSP